MNKLRDTLNQVWAIQTRLILALLGVIAAAGLGFTSGRTLEASHWQQEVARNQLNYTIKQLSDKGAGETEKTNQPQSDQSCIVKGNISSKGKKIYHVQTGAFYKSVSPEQCFKDENDAKSAGFIKSSR